MLEDLQKFLIECNRDDKDPEAYDITLKLSDGVEVEHVTDIDIFGDDITVRSTCCGVDTIIHTQRKDCLRWWRISE